MPPRNRLVRRRPLSKRLRDYLDPGDWTLWASEQLESEWAEQLQEHGTAIGLGANVLFLIARANSAGSTDDGDVFGDYEGRLGSGWFSWTCHILSCTLALLSLLNAAYTLLKRRPYRLFEQPLETAPETPSARRVRVESSPGANASPLRLLTSALSPAPAFGRAHPQEGRDVWELSVWDPPALGLELACLFSPLHVLVYGLFLPAAPLDPRPSVTWAKTLLLAALLSAQALTLRAGFAAQLRDRRLIAAGVLHEYDAKFVHPALHAPVRDVAVQTPTQDTAKRRPAKEVDVYAPHAVTTRGFRVSPNPAYAAAYDPDHALERTETPRFDADATPLTWRTTPAVPPSSAALPPDYSSPLRPVAAQRQQQRIQRSPVRHSTGTSMGEGGSLGVYSHAASPLKKAAGQNFMRRGREREREGSPLKRVSAAVGAAAGGDGGAGRHGRRGEGGSNAVILG